MQRDDIDMVNQQLSRENRANIVTARESLRRAANGYDDVDFGWAIGMLDQVLASTCPHDPGQYTRREVTRVNGRHQIEVMCPGCNLAWRECVQPGVLIPTQDPQNLGVSSHTLGSEGFEDVDRGAGVVAGSVGGVVAARGLR